MNAFWILVLLILVSGFFALSEMALASSRRSKLQAMADAGNPKARIALQIMDNPSRLLAATQTGITAAALLMGIYGESALSATFQHTIDQHFPALSSWANVISFTVTIALVTAFSIIFGEIVPKRLAIANPEKVAAFCAPFMAIFLKVLSPAIALLSKGSDLVLSFIPFKAAPAVSTIEEIQAFLDEGAKTGMLAPEERHLMSNVLRLEDRRLASVMTPVSDIAYLDLHAPREDNLRLLREAPHSMLPICKGSLQQVIGVAESHDILQAAMEGDIDFAEIPLQNALFVPASLTLVDLLRTFRQQKKTFAFVVSEFGMTEGIVTIDDVLSSVVGDMMPMMDTPEEALAVKRDDGSWLLDGLLPIDEMKVKLGIRDLPQEDLGNFHTVGGFVLASLGRIPKKTEKFDWNEWRFEVVDVDRNRVDQVLATPNAATHKSAI
ncbi:MAG: hemolysin family protein [Burkholderiales bacterium]|jgi:putative hemolysin|uniref:hemolysin family protein n=1 Tax=Limnobacter sp. TaxID=2003368 RepID=UPI0039BC9686|nr:hemolysin family protein [Burkholderiales bacterium]